MAEKRIVVKDCDRCGGRKKRAERTIRYSVDGEKYEVDVCEEHGRAFERDIGAWRRVSREVGPTNSFGPTKLSITKHREQEQDTRPQPPSVFIPQDLPPGEVHVQKLPPGYHTWSLSDHAKLRCEQRGISERDALITAADPQLCTPKRETDERETDDEWIYRRGPVIVVVDRKNKTVITVLNRDEEMEGAKTG